MKFHLVAAWLGVIPMVVACVVFAHAGQVYAAIGNGFAVAFLCAVGLPWRTLGRWMWRWWTGREFERKPVAEKPAEVNAADYYVIRDVPITKMEPEFRNLLSAQSVYANMQGGEYRGQTLPVGGAVALNQDPLRYSDSAQEAPVGIFGSFSWKDKDGVVHGGPFRGQTLDDVANPLAGLTAEQIAARVNRGEPVRVKDAFEALGLKQPTLDEAIINDPVRIKAEMLRQHMEGCQQGRED